MCVKCQRLLYFETEDPAQGGVTISGQVGKHTYVDLGLPSGTLWATYNVGTDTPLEIGGRYAWGETETKEAYTPSTYKYYDGKAYTKYTTASDTLESKDDAATANWGSAWCMPTSSQWLELTDSKNVSWTFTKDYNDYGVAGFVGTSVKNNNVIFIPANGLLSNANTKNFAYYWTSVLATKDPFYAGNAGYWANTSTGRTQGLCVRPVLKPASQWEPSVTGYYIKNKETYVYVDLGLPSGLKWATRNIGAKSDYASGSYFAWGEVETKDNYADDLTNYKYFDMKSKKVTKYSDTGDAVLSADDDAAAYNTAGLMRMPTEAEYKELKEYCSMNYTTDYKGTGSGMMFAVSQINGNIILFPYTGMMADDELISEGAGHYWTASNVKAGIGLSASYVKMRNKSMVTTSQQKSVGCAVRGVIAE